MLAFSYFFRQCPPHATSVPQWGQPAGWHVSLAFVLLAVRLDVVPYAKLTLCRSRPLADQYCNWVGDHIPYQVRAYALTQSTQDGPGRTGTGVTD